MFMHQELLSIIFQSLIHVSRKRTLPSNIRTVYLFFPLFPIGQRLNSAPQEDFFCCNVKICQLFSKLSEGFSECYCSPTSFPNHDKETEFQAATAWKICSFDYLKFPPCICILLFLCFMKRNPNFGAI